MVTVDGSNLLKVDQSSGKKWGGRHGMVCEKKSFQQNTHISQYNSNIRRKERLKRRCPSGVGVRCRCPVSVSGVGVGVYHK